jgi:hypothetical protein|tara:strand:+ start:2210 stop:2524 length:315 start_codon:yes stop_codon:yes gene_type:complete
MDAEQMREVLSKAVVEVTFTETRWVSKLNKNKVEVHTSLFTLDSNIVSTNDCPKYPGLHDLVHSGWIEFTSLVVAWDIKNKKWLQFNSEDVTSFLTDKNVQLVF